jgi:hypothetical protein
LAETIAAAAATSGFNLLSEKDKLSVLLQSIYVASSSSDDLDTLMTAANTAGFSKIADKRYKACILLRLMAGVSGDSTEGATAILAKAAASQFMFLSEAEKQSATLQLLSDYNDVDPDFADFLTRSGITDSTEISATNTFVEGLKADSLWDKVFAFYPHIGTTEQSHSQNLKSSAFPLKTPFPVASPGPVWNGEGVKIETGYGTLSNRLESTFTVADILSNIGTEFSFGAYWTDEAAKPALRLSLLGLQDTINGNYYKFDVLSTTQARTIHGTIDNLPTAAFPVQGWLVSDKQPTRIDLYRNGTSVASATGITAAMANTAYTFGWPGVRQEASVNVAFPSNMYDVRISCVIIAESLTGPEHVALSNRIATYQTALGRA